MQCKKCKSCPKLSFPKLIIIDKIRKETKRNTKKKGIEIKKSKCEITPNAILENSSNSNFKVILNLQGKIECICFLQHTSYWEFSSE